MGLLRLKKRIRNVIPPAMYKKLNDYKRLRYSDKELYYWGDFGSWDECLSASKREGGDYSDADILDSVAEATDKVIKGEASYEQDSVLFYQDNIQYSLMASLFYAYSCEAACNNNVVVADMGGSLGSTYFRYKKFLKQLDITWCINEQSNFAEYGRDNIPELRFYDDIEVLNEKENPNILLLCGVIQYLPDVYKWMERFVNFGIKYIIIDRTPFNVEDVNCDRLCVQHVPSSIYSARYPLQILSYRKFVNYMNKHGYKIVWKWKKTPSIQIKEKNKWIDTVERGFLYEKI